MFGAKIATYLADDWPGNKRRGKRLTVLLGSSELGNLRDPLSGFPSSFKISGLSLWPEKRFVRRPLKFAGGFFLGY